MAGSPRSAKASPKSSPRRKRFRDEQDDSEHDAGNACQSRPSHSSSSSSTAQKKDKNYGAIKAHMKAIFDIRVIPADLEAPDEQKEEADDADETPNVVKAAVKEVVTTKSSNRPARNGNSAAAKAKQRTQYQFTCNFCKWSRPGQGDQRAREHAMGTTLHNVHVKHICLQIAKETRNQLRKLNGLKPYVEPEQARRPSGPSQQEINQYVEREQQKSVDHNMCKAFYTNKIPFAVANNPHFLAFLRDVQASPHWKPLRRDRLAEMPRILKVEQELNELEDAIVANKPVCLCTDGGKILEHAGRNIMADAASGESFYVQTVSMSDEKKSSENTSLREIEILKQLLKRSWDIVGMVTDLNCVELGAQIKVKAFVEEQTQRLFMLQGCGMHAAGLLMEESLVSPKEKQSKKDHMEHFAEVRQVVQQVEKIVQFVKNRTKLRSRPVLSICSIGFWNQ